MAKRTCGCGECRKCKHREYMNAWYRRPGSAERVRGWAIRYRTENLEKIHEYDNARTRRRSPEKVRAHASVNRAIKLGTLVPPNVCDECGSEGQEFSDGRRPIQAHHDDYSRKLDVRWLCRACHGRAHRTVA